MIAGESPSSSSTSQRVFPAVQLLGCEALMMILVQSVNTDDLAADAAPVFTIGQFMSHFHSSTYLLILISSCAELRIRRTVSSSIWSGPVLQLLPPRMTCPGRLFSERTTLRSLYAIGRPSVCCLSVVCDVGAPYSGG